MSFTKKTFIDNQTVIMASDLNGIQDAIIENEQAISDIGDAYILPDYYESYINDKIKTINILENTISSNSDAFIFITDYHRGDRNTEHSMALIKRIMEHTGITKLIFGGDAFQTHSDKNTAMQNIADVYAEFNSLTEDFYPIIGNHEWNRTRTNTSGSYTPASKELTSSAIYNICLSRVVNKADGISSEGNYYIDNKLKKIRYYFLQFDGEARPTDATIEWFGHQLENIPSGYSVGVFQHYVFTGQSDEIKLASTSINKYISALFGAYKQRNQITLDNNKGSFNYQNARGRGMFLMGGHWHEDRSLTESQSEYGVLSITCTGDLYRNGSGTVFTGREAGTETEQAFDVIHVDLDSRKIYRTRIGGGSDASWTFSGNVSSESDGATNTEIVSGTLPTVVPGTLGGVKSGDIFSFYFKFTGLDSGTSVSLGTATYRPKLASYFTVYSSSSPYQPVATLYIATNGTITLYKSSSITAGYVSGTYIIR